MPLSVLVRHFLITAALCLLSAATASAAVPALWGSLAPGPFRVGFRVINAVDSTRHGRSQDFGRPMQVAIWYPAEPSPRGARLSYKDYFLLSARETDFRELTEARKAEVMKGYRELLVNNGIPVRAVERWMAAPMRAFTGLPSAPGLYPLVIVVQGYMQSAHHQAILSEYLASYGNIVATCPSQTRISGPLQSDSEVTGSALEQSSDIAYVIRTARGRFSADLTRTTIVAHSFGARSALLYLARHQEVRALVSLDGGIGARHANDFARSVLGFDTAGIQTPLLHFYQNADSTVVPDFGLIRSLSRSDRYLVKIDSMMHLDFTSLGMAAGTIPGFRASTGKMQGAAALKRKCEAMYAATAEFLRFSLSRPLGGLPGDGPADSGKSYAGPAGTAIAGVQSGSRTVQGPADGMTTIEPLLRLPKESMHLTRLPPGAK